MRLLNVSIYRKVHHQIFRNKRHLTKDISKNASRTLDFLSNVNEMKYKSKKLPKNRRSPEAIQVQLDMSHMRVGVFTLVGVAIHVFEIMSLGMSGHVSEHVRREMVQNNESRSCAHHVICCYFS